MGSGWAHRAGILPRRLSSTGTCQHRMSVPAKGPAADVTRCPGPNACEGPKPRLRSLSWQNVAAGELDGQDERDGQGQLTEALGGVAVGVAAELAEVGHPRVGAFHWPAQPQGQC